MEGALRDVARRQLTLKGTPAMATASDLEVVQRLDAALSAAERLSRPVAAMADGSDSGGDGTASAAAAAATAGARGSSQHGGRGHGSRSSRTGRNSSSVSTARPTGTGAPSAAAAAAAGGSVYTTDGTPLHEVLFRGATEADVARIVLLVCEWAVASHRTGIVRAFIAARLLTAHVGGGANGTSVAGAGGAPAAGGGSSSGRRRASTPARLPLHDTLMAFLDAYTPPDESAQQAVEVFFGELVRSKLFSYSRFLRTRVIPRNALSAATPEAAVFRSYVEALPLFGATVYEKSERRTTLYGTARPPDQCLPRAKSVRISLFFVCGFCFCFF